MNSAETVTDALRADVNRSPDALGADRFAGMGREMQARFARLGVELAEGFGSGAALVSSDADSDDRGVLRRSSAALRKTQRRFFRTEMADGIEYPVGGDAEVLLGLFAGALHACEERLELDAAPVVNDSRRRHTPRHGPRPAGQAAEACDR